ncbi:MAG: hypothetical protein Kow0022_04630 [Phycisphaerales bacterium]
MQNIDPRGKRVEGGTSKIAGIKFRPETSRGTPMHYPHRTSRIKKVRKSGFRARMATKSGRKILSNRRRIGRKLTNI